MARTGGEKTRQRILTVAEKLFARFGFDATSVDRIAQTAQVNKALIYYHFKNKNDLIQNLFTAVLDDLDEHLAELADPHAENGSLEQGFVEELKFLTRRKRTLSLALAEAFRSGAHSGFLFRCAEAAFARGHGQSTTAPKGQRSRAEQQQLVRDFFFGFQTVLSFVALKDRFCAHFGCDPQTVEDDFLDAFLRSHQALDPEQQ